MMMLRLCMLLLATCGAMADGDYGPATPVSEPQIPALFIVDLVLESVVNSTDQGKVIRVLLLQDDVLDSDAPEVSIPILPGLDIVVVWGPTSWPGEHKVPGTVKQLRNRAKAEPAGSDASGGERLVMSGTVKGFHEGETMVTIVLSATSYFCSVSFPATMEDGNVKTRMLQVESLPGDAYAGIATERFAPDVQQDPTIKIPNTDVPTPPTYPAIPV